MATVHPVDINEYRATPQSIARAKLEARREREEIRQKTGVVITDEGHVILPMHKVTMHCPSKGCQWVAHGRTPLGVVRSVAAHFKRVHLGAGPCD